MTILATLLLASEASAQQACIEPMSRIQLGSALGEVTDALEASELIEARSQLNAIRDRLPCLEEVVDRELFALFARSNAIVYFYGQDEEQAGRWAQASKLAAPALAWDEKLFPPNSQVRTVLDATPLPEVEGLGQGLAAPKGGGVFVNGQFIGRPEAWPDVPVLVQVFDRSGAPVEAFWQEGAAFPERLLTARTEELPPPSWWGTGAPSPRSNDKVRQPRPGGGPPVLPIAASAGLGILSAATYALASASATSFREEPHSSEELTALRTRTNLLVLASGASLAGAVGVGVGGVLISANGVSFRF